MPIPHEKCPLAVAKTRPHLLFMQYRFLDNADAASQVAFFQTQTFLHLIHRVRLPEVFHAADLRATQFSDGLLLLRLGVFAQIVL